MLTTTQMAYIRRWRAGVQDCARPWNGKRYHAKWTDYQKQMTHAFRYNNAKMRIDKPVSR